MASQLSIFPNEIFSHILRFLPNQEILKISLVDRRCRDIAFDLLRKDALHICKEAQTNSTPLYRSIKRLATEEDLKSSDKKVFQFFHNIINTINGLGLPCEDRLLDMTDVQTIDSQIDTLHQSELKKIWPNLLKIIQWANPEQNLNLTTDLNAQEIRKWLNENSALVQNVAGQLDLLEDQTLKIVPAEIGYFTHLKNLFVTSDQLTTLPAEIGNLTMLRYLVLGKGKLAMLPAEIGNLTKLVQLTLEDNQLATIPAEIGNLTELNYPHLERNQLTTLPAEIGNLKKLIMLTLRENQFTTIPDAIENLPANTLVTISRNPFSNTFKTFMQMKFSKRFKNLELR